MKVNITKEQLKTAGEVSVRIGKKVIVEGTKAVIMKGAIAAVEASFDPSAGGIKSLTLDKVLGDKKPKKEKKSFFKRKKVEEVENETSVVKVEEVVVTEPEETNK